MQGGKKNPAAKNPDFDCIYILYICIRVSQINPSIKIFMGHHSVRFRMSLSVYHKNFREFGGYFLLGRKLMVFDECNSLCIIGSKLVLT